MRIAVMGQFPITMDGLISAPLQLSGHRRVARAQAFARIPMSTIADFGGWAAAQKRHFADGGVFDQIYVPGG